MRKSCALVGHVVPAEAVAEDLEVIGAGHARVLLDLVEIGVGAPLADLVAHDRLVGILGDEVAVIGGRFRRPGIDSAAEARAPRLDPRAGVTW